MSQKDVGDHTPSLAIRRFYVKIILERRTYENNTWLFPKREEHTFESDGTEAEQRAAAWDAAAKYALQNDVRAIMVE